MVSVLILPGFDDLTFATGLPVSACNEVVSPTISGTVPSVRTTVSPERRGVASFARQVCSYAESRAAVDERNRWLGRSEGNTGPLKEPPLHGGNLRSRSRSKLCTRVAASCWPISARGLLLFRRLHEDALIAWRPETTKGSNRRRPWLYTFY